MDTFFLMIAVSTYMCLMYKIWTTKTTVKSRLKITAKITAILGPVIGYGIYLVH